MHGALIALSVANHPAALYGHYQLALSIQHRTIGMIKQLLKQAAHLRFKQNNSKIAQ